MAAQFEVPPVNEAAVVMLHPVLIAVGTPKPVRPLMEPVETMLQ